MISDAWPSYDPAMRADASVRIRSLRPEDAAALSACFERCYGRTYATPTFYDVEGLRAMIAARELRSVIATVGDRVIGHTALTVRHPRARAVEAGNTVVDPDYRGGGLLGRLGGALADLCRQAGYVGYVHYPTTAHAIMQARSVAGGGVETGVMLSYIPADTDYHGVARPSGRLAATVVYQPLARAPHRVIRIPRAYPWLSGLYTRLGLDRTFRPHAGALRGASRLIARSNERRGLLHVDCVTAGADLAAEIERLRTRAGAAVMHVDLDLGALGASAAVDALRGVGFYYCGLLPEFGDSDVLRLQWLAQRGSDAVELANPGARDLLARIRQDATTTPPPPSTERSTP
jgi:GNAT superfamily N-acetyltransferase